jgi:hypothetical protein
VISGPLNVAADRLGPHIRRTPLLRTSVDARPLAFKLEFLQVTGDSPCLVLSGANADWTP